MHYSILEVEKRIEVLLKFHEFPRICENARQNPFVEDERYITRTKNIPLQSIISIIRQMQFIILEWHLHIKFCIHILYRDFRDCPQCPSRSSDKSIVGKPAFDVQDEIMWITLMNYLAVDNPVRRGCCVR